MLSTNYLNDNYNFVLGGVNISVDIDDGLSAEYRTKKYPESDKNALHYHSLYEIFFIFDDGIKITFEDGVKEYKNCIVCIPPNTRHFARRSFDYRVLFSCEATEHLGSNFADFFINKFASDKVFCATDIKPEFKGYLEELCELFYKQNSEIVTECVISRLKLIFYHLFSSVTTAEEKTDPRTGSNYIIINRMISGCTTPGNNVSLSTVAEALHLSEKQTSRLIYKYYGRPLSKIITEDKLDYAAYLLTYTTIPISEVGFKCNFHSESYFYISFKQKFGYTPLQYRNKQQKTN